MMILGTVRFTPFARTISGRPFAILFDMTVGNDAPSENPASLVVSAVGLSKVGDVAFVFVFWYVWGLFD